MLPGVLSSHAEPRRQQCGQSSAGPGAQEPQKPCAGLLHRPGASSLLRGDSSLQTAPAVSEFAFAAVQGHLFKC